MKKLLLLCVLFAGLATNQADAQFAKVAFGPYLQAVGETEFTVVWTTTDDAVAWVEIAPDDGTHFYAKERPKYYETSFGRRPIGCLHRIHITGLTPATTYRYRIMQRTVLLDEGNQRVLYDEGYGSNIQSRPPFTVTTLNPKKQTVKFAVVNDMHEHDSLFRILFAKAKGQYDFVCTNGDMLSCTDSEEALFKNFLQSASQLFATNTPLYVARGNHGNRGKFATHFMDYFPSLTGYTYFAFREGPAYIIVLDSGEDKPDSDIRNFGLMCYDQYRRQEADWLKRVVESREFREAPVRIVLCHMPPDPKGWHGQVEVSSLFVPLLNHAGIDVMLCGHIHTYKYTAPDGDNGCRFPVLCNPSLCRLDVTADKDSVKMQITDTSGKMIHRNSVAVKRK